MSERCLCRQRSSPEEIADLIRVVDRDLADAAIEALSADRRFATAYNAVLKLANAVLRASGYRTSGSHHHWRTFQALPHIMGKREQGRADYFDTCRRKRNLADFDAADEISESEIRELCDEARSFRNDVLNWLEKHHPELRLES